MVQLYTFSDSIFISLSPLKMLFGYLKMIGSEGGFSINYCKFTADCSNMIAALPLLSCMWHCWILCGFFDYEFVHDSGAWSLYQDQFQSLLHYSWEMDSLNDYENRVFLTLHYVPDYTKITYLSVYILKPYVSSWTFDRH